MKVLIVEDSKDTAALLHMMLEPHGECELAEDGLLALQQIEKAWAEDDPFDAIVLDLMMPNMGGLEMLEQLREQEEERGYGGILGAKVVVLSALNDENTISKAISLGCEGYVSKANGTKEVITKLKEMGLVTAETLSKLPKSESA